MVGKMVQIGFVGDTCFNGSFSVEKFKKISINSIISEEIIEWLRTNNYNIFNIEGPITNYNQIIKKKNTIKSSPESIKVMEELKCNVLCLSNNHIMDCGIEGLEETIEIARKNGIKYFGAGRNLVEAAKPLIIIENDIRIAIFGMTHQEGKIADHYSAGPLSDYYEDYFKEKVLKIRNEVDWIILVYHGGEEYTFFPSPKRRKKLLKYLKWGIDIIVCHHAHVIQGYEEIENKYIFYSLGNFLFDTKTQRKMEGTTDSVLLKVNIMKENYTFKNKISHFDRKCERIISYENHPYFNKIDENKYIRLWRKDAARIIRGKIDINKNLADNKVVIKDEKEHQNWGKFLRNIIFNIIFNKRSYYYLLYLMSSPYMRQIFMAFIFHEYKKIIESKRSK